MTNATLNTPWSLHFDHDGTEDIAIIRDANGHDLVISRHFWLPEGDDPVPPTLAGMRVMTASPKLLAALKRLLDATGGLPITLSGAISDAIHQAQVALAEAEGRVS
jgi:hypothetical protein